MNTVENNELIERQEMLLQEFKNDSNVIGEQTEQYLRLVYPSYLVDKDNIESQMDSQSTHRLQSMTFYRIVSCTADNVEKVFESVNQRFEKLFTALYSINVPAAYGLVSRDGITNVVIGIYKSGDVETVRAITQGMLSGIELESITPSFTPKSNTNELWSIGRRSLAVCKRAKTNIQLIFHYAKPQRSKLYPSFYRKAC